ncbi:MAG: diguanylate cyclase domain-containing protein [Cuspidothrix sp.]
MSNLQLELQRKELVIREKEQKDRALYRVISKVRASLDVESIFITTTKETCKLLRVERIAVYRFNEDWGGEFVSDFEFAQPEVDNLQSIGKNTVWHDSYLQEHQGGRYRQNESCYVSNIKSKISVPLIKGNKLWGLLCVYQCDFPRTWTQGEIQFVKQLAAQFNVALEHAELLENSKTQTQKLADINQALETANASLEQLNNLDALTEIPNRRCFDAYLASEWQRHLREQQPLTVIMIDIDYFKFYNDYYGHQEGDICLIQVAQTIAKVPQRPLDLVARYGGEEFAGIFPHTNIEGGIRVGELIQIAIANLAIPHYKSKVSDIITLSLGVASLIPSVSNSPGDLIAHADQALYAAKNQGRNQIIYYNIVS